MMVLVNFRIYTVGGFPVFEGAEEGNLASWAASVPR